MAAPTAVAIAAVPMAARRRRRRDPEPERRVEGPLSGSLYDETFLAGAEMEILAPVSSPLRTRGEEMGWGLGCFAASADA